MNAYYFSISIYYTLYQAFDIEVITRDPAHESLYMKYPIHWQYL